MSDFKKRNIIIGALCGVLLLMMVGYAAFQSVLNINGTANITSNWNVLITNIEESDKVGDATSVKGYPTHEDLTATFQTNLVSPGDSITYNVTIENQGNINAILEKITLPQLNNEAIVITTSGLEVGSELNVGGSAVLKVKVEYNPNITSQPKNTEASFEMTLDYAQKDTSEITPQTVLNMKGVEVPLATEEDGLYEDTYEPGRYVYKGANPDNYITFNGEEWRIIAIETDGTIKIMKSPTDTTLLPARAFDIKGKRTTGYCGQGNASNYSCNVWAATDNYTNANGLFFGKVTADSEMKEYLNNEYYNTIKINKDSIENHLFYYGSPTWESTDLAVQVKEEKKYSAKSNVGLIQASDYIKANTNTTYCSTFKLVRTNYSICGETTWMVKDLNSGGYWTLSPHSAFTYHMVTVYFNGLLSNGTADITSVSVVPTLYLKSTIQLSGSGTSENPYTITN